MNKTLLAAAIFLTAGTALAADNLIPGKIVIIKDGKLFKLVAKPISPALFPLPTPMGTADPTGNPSAVLVIDTGGPGQLTDPLAGTWTGLGSPAGSKGYKYKNASAPTGGAVKSALIKEKVIKIIAKDDGTLNGPVVGQVGIKLTTGTDNYCASFGGTPVKNDPGLVKRKDAPAPGACPGSTTTSVTSTSSSTVTSTTFDPMIPCCGGATHSAFVSGVGTGNCGTLTSVSGAQFAPVVCSGLYFGGGGNSVPLPADTPDLGSTVVEFTSCVGQAATVGPTTSAETGSNLNCSVPGCLFGAPLPIPNPSSTPTSTCVINFVSSPAAGSARCDIGETNIDLPLGSDIHLIGDGSPGLPGIQVCPVCLGGDPMTPGSGTCDGGPNNGMACTPQSTDQGGLEQYPTSHECPPDPMLSIGTIPIGLELTTGTVTWTGTTATNDTSVEANQPRVFCGYCRDRDITSNFQNPFQQCWENGMAVGGACAQPFETCEQRAQGAFGPGGGGVATITVQGVLAGPTVTAGPHPQKLVTNFCIPPTFNFTVDAAADLPGPGALALDGDVYGCASANPCP